MEFNIIHQIYLCKFKERVAIITIISDFLNSSLNGKNLFFDKAFTRKAGIFMTKYYNGDLRELIYARPNI